jgi:hypothetical protein
MPQVPRASTPTEVLVGLVERVTFQNEENGFCVLRVKARGQRDLITVLGHAAMIRDWRVRSGQRSCVLLRTVSLTSARNCRSS